MSNFKNRKPSHVPSTVTKAMSDNFESLLSGFGNRSDHTAWLAPGQGILLPDVALSNIYTSEGLGAKIITQLPHDMVKHGYRISGDTDGIIQKELKRLNNKKVMHDALTWMRTYGGAITVIGVSDGRDLSRPVANTVKGIQWLKTVARTRVMVDDREIITNPNDPDFGDYEFYHIQFDRHGGMYHKVHRSRCLVYKGVPAPDDPHWSGTNDQLYWGLSAIQAPWDQLKQLGASFQGIAHLMMELVIGKYKFKDLATMLSSPDKPLIMNRLELINQSKSIINGVVLDTDEDYIRDMVNVSGSDKILEQLMIMLSAATGYPVTVLFGRSPDGMNATGESDLSNYDSLVEASQETKLEGPQQKLVKIINSYKKVNLGADDPVIQFNPVRSPSAKERVDIRKIQAEVDTMYAMLGTHTPEQITEMRFGGGYDPDNMDIEEYITNTRPTVAAALPNKPAVTTPIDREE